MGDPVRDERERAAATLAALPGGAALIEWFGHATAFHDFTILSIDLGDCSSALLRIHGWRTTGETGPDGCYICDRHAVITVTLSGVSRVDLDDLHMLPAIIFGLYFERTGDAVTAGWDSSYGASGSVTAHAARIEFVPGEPARPD